MSDNAFTHDNATYAAPGGVVSTSNHKIAFSSVWPSALHIVFSYAGRKGKTVCFLSFRVTGYTATTQSLGNFRNMVVLCTYIYNPILFVNVLCYHDTHAAKNVGRDIVVIKLYTCNRFTTFKKAFSDDGVYYICSLVRVR